MIVVKVIKDVNGRYDDYSITPKLDKCYYIRVMN